MELESDSAVIAAGPEVKLAKWNLIEAVLCYKLTISSTNRKSVTRPGECHSELKVKNLASVVGRHFVCHFGLEGGRSRLVGAGFSSTDCLGDEAAR